MRELQIRNATLSARLCNWRESLLPSAEATGCQRSLFVPLPFGKTLWLSAYSWAFDHVETEPLLTGPIECARCGEEFESTTERTMHVLRERCPEIDGEDEADAVDSIHALEDAFR